MLHTNSLTGGQDADPSHPQVPTSLRGLSLPAIQMVIPGDPEEMRTFQSRALALSRCSLEVVLPSAHVFLPSKEVYESLYNRWRRSGRLVAGRQGAGLGLRPATIDPPACLRINNGLLLWEPADLLPAPTPAAQPPGFPGPSGFWHDNFKMCKSAFKLGRRSHRRGPRAPEPPRAGRGGGRPPRPASHSAP